MKTVEVSLAFLLCFLVFTWGSRGQAAPVVWVYNEFTVLGSTIHGTSVVLKKPLVAGTQLVYRNGLRQTPGIDYTVSGATITFAPKYGGLSPGDVLNIDYRTQ
jgi:hypothetical protein